MLVERFIKKHVDLLIWPPSIVFFEKKKETEHFCHIVFDSWNRKAASSNIG